MAFTEDSDGSSACTPPDDTRDERLQFKLESPDFDSFEHISDTDCDPNHDIASVCSGHSSMDVEEGMGDDLNTERENKIIEDADDECSCSDNDSDNKIESLEAQDTVHDDETRNAIRLGTIETHTETNEYQTELRVYVNRCVFIRTTNIGKRVGFAPSLPRTKTFYKCWTCDDWIAAGASPICIPLCSNLHLTSKYVFERMIGLFCSWGCCKKYIHTTMTVAQRSKYMRSLHLLRKLFCPDIAYTPIETIESRTEMNSWGGPLTPQQYYSKIVKVNLRPLPEDICFWNSSASKADSNRNESDEKKRESPNSRTGIET